MSKNNLIKRVAISLPTACLIAMTSVCGATPFVYAKNIHSIDNLKFTAELDGPENTKAPALESKVNYNEDSTVATLHIEYSNPDYTLSLTKDSEEFYTDVFKKGLLTKKGTTTNVLEYEASTNGIYYFDVDIKNTNGDIIDTKTVKFKILDIVQPETIQNDSENVQEENKIAPQTQEDTSQAVVQSSSSVETTHDSQSVNVHYTSNGVYSWTIPSDIDLNSQNTLTVAATKTNEVANASLKIKMSSENDYKLKTASGVSAGYTVLKNGNVLTNNTTVLETTKSGTSSVNLKFNANPGNFLMADTYNDKLTFTAMNGYAAGTVLEIGGKKYIVVAQAENDTYELISGESIGNIQFQPNQDSKGNYYDIGVWNENDLPTNRHDGQNSNVYEDSYIDKYLETTYYNNLPEELKKAIVATQIKQVSYTNTGSNSKWSYLTKDTNPASPDGTSNWFYNEGTPENPKYVRWDKVTTPDGEGGIYPLKYWTKQEKGYKGQPYNTITRRVYLPSVEEISNLVDLNDANKIYTFLKGTNNSLNHMWLRDASSGSPRYAMNLDYCIRSLSDSYVTNPWVGVRPAFTVDLSTISDITVVDSVSYK